jgi:hypothetical protein
MPILHSRRLFFWHVLVVWGFVGKTLAAYPVICNLKVMYLEKVISSVIARREATKQSYDFR